MSDQDQVQDQNKEAAAAETPAPEVFNVTVINVENGENKELFARQCAFNRKDTFMKGVRQKIRDLGLEIDGEKATIRQATVTNSENGDTKTIVFTNAVITGKKPAAATSRQGSNARKNAEATEGNETDAEILGILRSDDQSEDDRREALLKYKRHLLIHAHNINVPAEAKLNHYSTKVAAVDALFELL